MNMPFHKIKEVHLRWVGIIALSYIMTFIFRPEEGDSFWASYLKSFAFTTAYWNVAFFFFIYFRKQYPEIRQTPKRLLITFIVVTFMFVVLDPILCLIIEFDEFDRNYFMSGEFLKMMPVNLIAAAVVGSLYENVYFFDKWKDTIRLNEALKNQQVRTQFEVLQNQMSPHFLFNSLNTLTTLIAEDSRIAIDFTEKLSEVYRYILQNKEKEVVHLKEELDFVKNYVFLLKIRYPENLMVDFNVDAQYETSSIAPLTIQILVENAIKHNVVSKTKPLQIDIYVENGKSIVVKNNLQKKNTIEKSTKTGLANIRRRYEYFGKRNIDVIITANNYIVAVPLLEVKSASEQLEKAAL